MWTRHKCSCCCDFEVVVPGENPCRQASKGSGLLFKHNTNISALLKSVLSKSILIHTVFIKAFSSFFPFFFSPSSNNPSQFHPRLPLPESEPCHSSEAEPLGAGPDLPRCKVEMLMLIKSFIWFRLISVALLLRRAVANQIRPSWGSRRADGYGRGSLWSPAAVCLTESRRREELVTCSRAFSPPLTHLCFSTSSV